MGLKCLDIIISSYDEFKEDLYDAVEYGGDSGKKRKSISADSLETVKRILSPNKLGILTAISRRGPRSINQLAKLVKREYPHVFKDCKTLDSLGLINLERTEGKKKQFIPKLAFDYDIIRVHSEIDEVYPISEKSNKLLLDSVG